ncbi:hypothetical protein ACO0RG_001786 [Hanseniaspora osmophila]|uniref:Replication factor A protein 3 n=1 Tax=Hanseniaspora osmophila TaxID=56408 RepID=A0A1E5RI99_9ASCO|nr:Replication factor A protein 3 [Hanseniaspora osmophila]
MSTQGVTHRVDGSSLIQHQGQIVRLVGYIDPEAPQNKTIFNAASSGLGNNAEIALTCPSSSPSGKEVEMVPINSCKIAMSVLNAKVIPPLSANSGATKKVWFEFIVRVSDGGDLSVMILDVIPLLFEENEDLNMKGVTTLSVVAGNLPNLFG